LNGPSTVRLAAERAHVGLHAGVEVGLHQHLHRRAEAEVSGAAGHRLHQDLLPPGAAVQIAGIFQRSVLIDAVIGGAFGLLFGAAALAVLGARFAALQSGMVESGSLSALDWVVVALVPVAMTVVALVTARRTVMTRLGRML